MIVFAAVSDSVAVAVAQLAFDYDEIAQLACEEESHVQVADTSQEELHMASQEILDQAETPADQNVDLVEDNSRGMEEAGTEEVELAAVDSAD